MGIRDRYEQDAYTDLLKKTPKVGAIVNTPDGKGLVVENNLIARTLKAVSYTHPSKSSQSIFAIATMSFDFVL